MTITICKLAERRWVRRWCHFLHNLFMIYMEQTFSDNSPLKPLFHVPFIDDIFMTWTHGREELEQFTTRANSTHPSIKFTYVISFTSLPFLDVLVSVTETGIKTNKLHLHTDNSLNNKLSNPIILAIKQPLTLQQLYTRSKNTLMQCNRPCHKPQCKVCPRFDTSCSIQFDNNVTISADKADSDSQNVVYILFSAMFPDAVHVG